MSRAPSSAHGQSYVGWLLRTTGRIRESLDEAERAYRLNALDAMSANGVALARMAAGRIADAVPVYEALVARSPGMSFPLASLLRAHAFAANWPEVDRLLELAGTHPLREFTDGLPFIRAKREPTPANIAAWRDSVESYVARTGGIDVSRLVYSAHLGLVEDAYRWAEAARLAPPEHPTTSWDRTATGLRCCSSTACPSCATTRAFRGCARGWGWSNSGP